MIDKNKILNNIKQSIEEYWNSEHDFKFDPNKPVVRLHEPSFGPEEICAGLEPMLTTFVTMGKKVKEFEKQYASHFGHKYGVMNNSGSSANLLAIAAIANKQTENCLNPGDEVIVPALSWSTTVWPLIQLGLIPVFVDCDLASFNFDMDKLEAAIGQKTKAIMLVHVYGNPCDMDRINEIVKKHKLQLIEDCCEAMGAEYKGKPVGTFGRVATFSFYYSHHITTLEGGICVTDDYDLTETMRVLRAHGWSREAEGHQKYVEKYPDIDPRFIFINLGYNLRPTEVNAAMGMIQLPKLAGFIEKRRKAAAYFLEKLDKYSKYFLFQQETEKGKHVWFGFALIVKEDAPFKASDVALHLQSKNIETRPIIAGNMARHPALNDYQHRIAGNLNNADTIMQRGLAFGCHHAVDEAACDYIIGQIDSFMEAQGLRQAA